jgi:hypothetical protein
MYLSLCNPQKALATIEARIFKSKNPASGHTVPFSKKPCDIHIKSVFLKDRSLGQSPAFKLHQILLGFNRYHNFDLTHRIHFFITFKVNDK